MLTINTMYHRDATGGSPSVATSGDQVDVNPFEQHASLILFTLLSATTQEVAMKSGTATQSQGVLVQDMQLFTLVRVAIPRRPSQQTAMLSKRNCSQRGYGPQLPLHPKCEISFNHRRGVTD